MTKGKDYTEGRWRDNINYECTQCQYSTLWFGKMEKHYQDKLHIWSFPGDGKKKRRRKKIQPEPVY